VTTAPKPIRQADVSETPQRQTTARVQPTTKATETAFENIAANTFYQIMFSEETTPEQKQAAVTQALTFTGSKEESRQRAKELEEFKEWLQERRQTMNTIIIKLTNTEAFAELQAVYEEMNAALNDFDNKMKPLMEIISAVHELRTQGLTFDTFKEIQADREFEAENARRTDEKARDVQRVDESIQRLKDDVLALSEQKTLWGLGGIKESARVAIALKEEQIKQADVRKAALGGEIDGLREQLRQRQNQTGEHAQRKAKLRELLDLRGEDHRQRQTDLVKAALHFVETSKTRISSVRAHLGGMNEQIENLFDANQHISRVYAVLGEGITTAEKKNQEVRAGLEPPKDSEESLIQKHTREEKKTAIEQHMATLTDAKQDTMVTFADLTGQTIRIKTMLEANTAQVSRVKTMQSQGVAGVADRLATVLQAVSQAALGESSAAAKDTLALMVESTNRVAQDQTIATAMGIGDANKDLLRAIDDLGAYGEVLREATAITQAGVQEARGYLEQLRTLAEDVKGDIGEAFAVHAEAALGTPPKKADKPAVKSPFSFGA
jgi:chromosome segregation ATPase